MNTKPVDVEALRGHTPGPWSEPYWDDEPGDRGWWIHNGKTGSGEYAVALTAGYTPNGKADARLIAAAPALLAEVIAMRAELAAKDAAVAELVEALESIRQYGSDTLSGHCDRETYSEWHRESVVEMTCKAKNALANFRGAK